MSDSAPTSSDSSATAKPKKKRRTWPQRIKLTILALLILAGVFRIALNILLPTVIRKVAAIYDLNCEYRRMDMSLLGGNAHIWDLVLRPKQGGESIVAADYVQGNISPLNLLRGRLVVYRAEVDGVNIVVDREPDGSIPLLKKLMPGSTAAAAPVTPKTSSGEAPKAPSLDSPLQIDAIRVSHVNTKFHDRSVSPEFETTIKTTLRISNVGAGNQRPAQFELEVEMDPLLDTLLVQGEAHPSPNSLKANVDVMLRGLHLKRAAGYLAPLGLKPIAEDMTLRAKLALSADVIPNSPDVSATVAVSDISAVVDGAECASLQKVTLDAAKLSAAGAQLSRLLIEDGQVQAQRSADGVLRIAGIEFNAAAQAPTTAPTTPAVNKRAEVAAASPIRFPISLDELSLKDLRATFDDAAIEPPAKLEAQVVDLSVKNINTEPASQAAPVSIAGTFSLPRIVQTIRIAGSSTPFASNKQLELKLAGDGVKPDALANYFKRLGIESQIVGATFDATLNAAASIEPGGAIVANASVTGVHFTDGQASLLTFDAAKIAHARIDPASGAIALGTIELSGPALEIRRDREGRFSAAGLRIVPASPSSTRTVAVAQSAGAAKPWNPTMTLQNLPRIEISRFRWDKVDVRLLDESRSPPVTLALGDAGIEVSDVVIDPSLAEPDQKRGTFRAWLAAPNVVDSFNVDGTIGAGAHQVSVDLTAAGKGISGASIASYLEPFGIVPVMKAGAFNAKGAASLTQTDDGLVAALDLSDVRYTDGGTDLAGVDRVHLAGMKLKPASVAIDELIISRPWGSAARNADGSFEAGGVRISSNADRASSPTTAPAAASTASAPAPLRLPALPIAASVKTFRLDSALFEWSDRFVSPAVKTHLSATVNLTDAQIGPPDAAPATLRVTASVNGSIDNALVEGKLHLSPEAPGAQLKIVADGVRAGALSAYLPPHIIATLKDGYFAASIDVGASNSPAGGIAAHFASSELTFADRADKTNWLKLDAFTFAADRIDPAGDTIALRELSSAGVAAELRRTANGEMEALGLRIKPSQPASSGSSSPGAPPANPPPAQPVPVAATQPAIDTATLVANSRRPLPLVTLAKLDLNLRQLRAIGLAEPSSAPIEVANVRIRNTAPIVAGGPDAETRDPIRLQLDGAINPIISQFAVAIESAPLAPEPSIKLDVTASGIKGRGVTDVLPALRTKIDGSKLTEGEFRTHLEASLNYGRRGPRDLDLSRGFTAMFDVKPVEFRETPSGSVIAGLDEIRGEGIKVEPSTGIVLIKLIEVTKPTCRIAREADGIHAFGLIIPIGSGGETEEPPPTRLASDTASPPAEVAASATPAPLARPANEIRLDRLTVSGIDVIIEDRTSQPVTVVPLKTLDLELNDVSNQMPWTGKPMRFTLLCTSDKVSLPPRKGAGSAGGEEMRELFSQVSASGRVGVKQNSDRMVLDGWAKTSVNGFELLGVRGLAEQQGVTIGGGAFDDSNDIRFRPDGNIDTKNHLVLTNLSLSEGPDGPLRKLFQLPAPIDVAIGAVTDPDGSITMDIPVPIKSGTIQGSDIMAPAVGAVAQVLITGIASAPAKAIGGIADLAGLGGKKGAKPGEPITIAFLPGYTELDQSGQAALKQLAQRMRSDKNLELQVHHSLTTADIVRASLRANPPPEDCLALAERLRERKRQLIDERSVLSSRLLGEIESGSRAQSKTSLEQLRAIDRQLAQAEDSLDQLYDLLRPGAQSQAERRTRAASLEIGRQRMDVIRSTLVREAGAPTEARIHLTNPQFEPADSSHGGSIVVTLVVKKK